MNWSRQKFSKLTKSNQVFWHHTPQVSSGILKTATIAVLAAMIVVPAARIAALSAGTHLHPAACHHHGSKAPDPANFSCCLSGHNSAIVPAHFNIQSAATALALILPDGSLVVTVSGTNLKDVTCTSGDPPGNLPLRI